MNSIQRAPAVERLFPRDVIAFQCRGFASPDDLHPSERECVARSVEKRVREFATGRLCARAGLTELGRTPTPLRCGLDRMPMWPSGVVGSITHADGYCVAVVGLQARFAAIGVDAEWADDVTPSLWQLTMRDEELHGLEGLEEVARSRTAAVIFSAKEAFYKCQYALTHSWLGFEDVVVGISDGIFEILVVKATHPLHHARSWIGRYQVCDGLVVTGIAA